MALRVGHLNRHFMYSPKGFRPMALLRRCHPPNVRKLSPHHPLFESSALRDTKKPHTTYETFFMAPHQGSGQFLLGNLRVFYEVN